QRLEQSVQYTAGPEDAAEWVALLNPCVVAPYATFNFSRWSMAPEVLPFHRALQGRGLGARLMPLRPFEAIEAGEWDRKAVFAFRRNAHLAWSYLSLAWKRSGVPNLLRRGRQLLRRMIGRESTTAAFSHHH